MGKNSSKNIILEMKNSKRKQVESKSRRSWSLWYVVPALALISLVLWVGYAAYNRHMIMDVVGTIVDGSTGQVFDKGNLTAEIGDKRQIIGIDGKFSFSGVRRDGVLKVSGPYLYEELLVDINGRSEIDVVVDVSMEQVLVLLGQHYKYRRFRSIYEMLDDDIKSEISEADYLAIENKKRDELLEGGDPMSCTVESVMFENRERDEDKVNMDMVLYLSENCLLEKEISTVYLEKSEEGWVWGHILDQ